MKKYTLACCLMLCVGGAIAAAPTPPPAAAPGKSTSSGPSKKGAEAPAPSTAKGADAATATPKPARKPKLEEAAKAPTEIDGEEMDFVKETNIAVFTGNVHVIDPRFDMTADKLTAYLRNKAADPGSPPASADPAPLAPPAATPASKGNSAGKGNPAPKGTPAAKGTPAKPSSPSPVVPAAGAAAEKTAEAEKKAGGLQKAIAEGSVVIRQDKPSTEEEGKIEHNIAHARMADYNADTQNMVLSGKPDAMQGQNQVIALDENTIIVMNKDGNMSVHGPHKMLIYENSNTSDSKSGNAR